MDIYGRDNGTTKLNSDLIDNGNNGYEVWIPLNKRKGGLLYEVR